MPSTKTLRVTLSDIVGGTGGSGSTAAVFARYVDTSGRGRDIHLDDGTIVVPVRRTVTPDTDPEWFDFTVIPSDDADVREEDQGFLTEVTWTVTAPTGGKTSGARKVLVPSTADAIVQLGTLYDPPAIPASTAQRIISGGTAETQVYDIRLRTGSSAEWAAEDPVLSLGEEGIDTDTGTRKVGDGVTAWSSLPASGGGGGGGGSSVHGDLTGRSVADQHPIGAITGLQTALDGKATTAQGAKAETATQPADLTAGLATKANTSHGHAIADTTGLQAALDAKADDLGADDNYVTDAEKVKLSNLSGTNTGDQTLPTWSTISGKPAVVAAGATQADARTAIGAGTSSFSGDYDDLTDKPTLGTAAATASTAYATAAQGALADTALQAATAQAINAQTGTSYTLVAGDAGKVVTLSNAGAITLNAPGSTFTTGQRVDVVVIGAGMATVVGTSGATANGTPSLVSRAQWSAFTILWTSATTCVVIGDMA